MKINKKITAKNLSHIAGTVWVCAMILFFGILYKGSYSEQLVWSKYLSTALIGDIIIGGVAFILFIVFNIRDSSKNTVTSESNTRTDPTKCSYCAETIKKEAIKCKHCGEMLSVESIPLSKQKLNQDKKINDFTLIVLVFGLIVLGISIVDSKAFEGVRSNNSIPSFKPTVTPTPKPTTTPKPNPTTTSKTNASTSQITCIGPDDKQFITSMEKCKALNDKWDHPTDYMINCNIHPDCGGGTEYMAKSQCDKPCSGKTTTPIATTSTNKQTTPTTQLNYYCYDNTLKYSYYTSSGEQCNLNNSKSLCKGFVKSTYDICMDGCLSEAKSNSSFCIYSINPSSPEYDACQSEKSEKHQKII